MELCQTIKSHQKEMEEDMWCTQEMCKPFQNHLKFQTLPVALLYDTETLLKFIPDASNEHQCYVIQAFF